MSSSHPAPRDEGERGSAIERLHAAEAERSRAHEAADATHDDPAANASLQGAEEQVLARERWLKAVDEHNDT